MSERSTEIKYVEADENTLWGQTVWIRTVLVFVSYVGTVYWLGLNFGFDDEFHKRTAQVLIKPPGSILLLQMAMLSVLLAPVCAGRLGQGKLALGVTLLLDALWGVSAVIAVYLGSDLDFDHQLRVLALTVVMMLLVSGISLCFITYLLCRTNRDHE